MGFIPSGNAIPTSDWNTTYTKYTHSVNYVFYRPSGVPQFDQVVKGTGDQLVLMRRRPLHSGDPASVGGQRQQHQ